MAKQSTTALQPQCWGGAPSTWSTWPGILHKDANRSPEAAFVVHLTSAHPGGPESIHVGLRASTQLDHAGTAHSGTCGGGHKTLVSLLRHLSGTSEASRGLGPPAGRCCVGPPDLYWGTHPQLLAGPSSCQRASAIPVLSLTVRWEQRVAMPGHEWHTDPGTQQKTQGLP